ncbi:DUF5667 domain-containing protein [Actinacidiphila glaucinigra]|uniref:DUF5667 domain-containing protein n=1 Tax=Actinacidiphila glaucinigra TaxID=235986 RepID=UPI002E2FCCB1|nr:DUF5667 domain-containing protein [Actinacidiphila glaucinigra]
MIANPTAHRRANAFADALEGEGPQTGAGVQHGAHAADRHADPEQGVFLALADALQDVPRPMLDPETKTVQRAQLIAAMEAALADGTLTVPVQRDGGRGAHRAGGRGLGKLKPRSAWSRRLAAGGLSVGVAAGALGGVAAASTDALPGDTLYGLKRGMEDMRLNLADDDADRGKVYLDLASTRLQEARRLMERGRGGDLDDESVGEIRRALSGMQQEASEGHRLLAAAYRKDGSLRPIETLSAFSSNHRRGWTELRGRLPSRLDDVGNKVTSVFDAIEDEVAPLQKLLPPDTGAGHSDGRGVPGGGNRSASGTRGPSPSVSGSASGSAEERGGDKAGPSASRSADSGIIGGTGDLLDPTPTGSSPGGDGTQPSVTLPPLLPGLLPGLGLSAEDDRDD